MKRKTALITRCSECGCMKHIRPICKRCREKELNTAREDDQDKLLKLIGMPIDELERIKKISDDQGFKHEG